jgi:hypothetical protein
MSFAFANATFRPAKLNAYLVQDAVAGLHALSVQWESIATNINQGSVEFDADWIMSNPLVEC